MIERLSERIIEYLTTVSQDLWWVASTHHVLLLAVLGVYISMRKKGRSLHWLVTIEVILLCATVSYAAFQSRNLFNGVVFGSVLFFWVSEIALGRMAPEWKKVSHTRRILTILVAVWGFYYPHFIEEPYLTGIWRSPVGLVPCPTLMLILAWCVFAVPEHNHVIYWIMMGVGLFYGLVGVFALRVWHDLPLIFIATYGLVLPLLPHHATSEEERATIGQKTGTGEED